MLCCLHLWVILLSPLVTIPFFLVFFLLLTGKLVSRETKDGLRGWYLVGRRLVIAGVLFYFGIIWVFFCPSDPLHRASAYKYS